MGATRTGHWLVLLAWPYDGIRSANTRVQPSRRTAMVSKQEK
jgi:hypothetical protein